MDPLLLLIGLSLTGTIGFAAVYAYERVMVPQGVIRDRVAAGRPDAVMRPTSALRDNRRSRFPLVDALPLSPAARERMDAELDRAGKPLKVSEYLGMRLVSGVLFALLGAAAAARLGGPAPVLILCAAAGVFAGWMLPRMWLRHATSRRLAQMEEALPRALTAIAKSLRAGTGLLQALAYAAEETPAPLGEELQSTLRDLQLGADPAETFSALADRVGSRDLDIAVTAIIIQRTVGGNLSEILTNVTSTIYERVQLQREVKVLTARQRLTAFLIAALPVLVAVAFIGLHPDMGTLLVNTVAGRISLAIGLAFEALGIFLIWRL
ncbi:MAG: type II secretion system F family protein, partial [Hyphomicrobiales bacterium]